VVISFPFGVAGVWDFLEKAGNLVVGDVCLSSPHQNRNVDSPQTCVGIRNRATNYGCRDLGISSRGPNRSVSLAAEMRSAYFRNFSPSRRTWGVPAVSRSCVWPCSASGLRNRATLSYSRHVFDRGMALAWAAFYSDDSSPERDWLV
jgi:hypothetical protein